MYRNDCFSLRCSSDPSSPTQLYLTLKTGEKEITRQPHQVSLFEETAQALTKENPVQVLFLETTDEFVSFVVKSFSSVLKPYMAYQRSVVQERASISEPDGYYEPENLIHVLLNTFLDTSPQKTPFLHYLMRNLDSKDLLQSLYSEFYILCYEDYLRRKIDAPLVFCKAPSSTLNPDRLEKLCNYLETYHQVSPEDVQSPSLGLQDFRSSASR